MTFLTPLLLAGLGAISIPVLIHLIQRERKRVVEFPSLMFVRRIPYQSVRRRRVRHWWLLLLRVAAIILLVLAFARPFLPQSAAAIAATGGAREVVILLDQSSSMGYGDHWKKAQAAATSVVGGLGAGDRGTLVLFSRNAEENMRATPERDRLNAAIAAARVTSGSTRYSPALKLAESILSRSPLARREAVLISDFQKSGWANADDAHFPSGTTLTTVSVAEEKTANLSVPSVTFGRSVFAGQERITVTAGVSNKGDQAVTGVPVTLSIEGRDIQTEHASVAARSAASVTFMPFTLAEGGVRGSVRAGADALPADNTFHFVATPGAPVSVLLVESERGAGVFLAKALAIGNAPAFQVEVMPASRLTPASFDKRALVIFDDVPFPSAAAGGVLKHYVERGGGILFIAGNRGTWPSDQSDVMPGRLGTAVDRASGQNGTLGYLDYSHPVFEVFKAPRSGDFSSAHIFQYRALTADPAAHVLARFDDGGVAAAERRVGGGRVIVWTSTLDDTWTDLALKPVYLPLVHQLAKYLARYEQTTSWFTVGQVVDLAASIPKARGDRIVVTPSGQRRTQPAGGSGLLELDEQGVYDVRAPGATGGRLASIAVNLDPAEADLTPLDPHELVAAVTGRATARANAPTPAAELSREDSERRQSLWWYLLFAGVILLAVEAAVANRLSRRERFL